MTSVPAPVSAPASSPARVPAHTPGPWIVRDTHPTKAVFSIEPAVLDWRAPGAMASGIASVSRYCDRASDRVSKTDAAAYRRQHRANAHLISAAPELLGAVRDLLAASECGSLAKMQAATIAARFAIAKAEGRA